MNFFDKFFLKLFLYTSPLLQKLEIDIDQLKAILVAKLTMDNRRPAAFQQMRQSKEKKEINSATLKTMFVSLIMGLFFLMGFAIGDDMITKLTIFFSMFIFMLAATLITDFTSVLIDTRDNLIILPKPVSDATFVTSRLMHIAIHINKLLLPLALPALIALIVLYGPATIVPFILMTFFATLLSIFLVNAVYLLILQLVKPSKFQSVISYFQIIFAVFIYGGYQLVPRMMERAGIEHLKMSEIHHIGFLPPYWFADACNSLSTFTFNQGNIINLFMALGLPIMSIYVVVKYFAPAFNRNLSMISSTSEETKVKTASTQSAANFKMNWLEKLATKITSDRTEYMGFLFTWKMMGRSRDFKMKVYPAFGYMVVFFALMIFQSEKLSLNDFSDMTSRGKTLFISIVYFSSFILISAVGQLRYSEKYKAAWLFSITPVDIPGRLISGALKSVIVCFYIPVIMGITLLGLFLIGPAIIPNLVLGCFNVIAVSTLMTYVNLRQLPFTVSMQDAPKGQTMIRNLFATLLPVIAGVCHYFIFDYLWAIGLLAILAIIASWMIMDSIKNLGWAKIVNFDVKG